MILRKLLITLFGVIVLMSGLLAQTRCAIYEKYQATPLSEVLHHLEEHCNTTFSMNESELSRVRVTKNFQGALLPDVLRILLTDVGYEFEFQSNGRPTIIRPKPATIINVSGTVIDDSTGIPLYMAAVQCANRPQEGCYTDQQGHFSLNFSTNKPEELIISYVGKRAQKIFIHPQHTNPVLHVRLKDKLVQYGIDITSGGELKVKIEDAAGKISIDPSDIGYLSGLGEADVFRSLQLLPGVSVGDESAASLNVRGGTEDQNLILLDGITLYEPNHFYGLVSAFNNQAIKDVRLHRGAYDARFGGRVSSVIEVIGRPHKRQQNRTGGALNMMNANLFKEHHLKKGNLSFLVAARRSYGDWIRNRLFDKLLGYQVQAGSIAQNLQRQLTQDPSQSPIFWFGDINLKATYTSPKKDRFVAAIYGGMDQLSHDFHTFVPLSFQENTYNTLRQRTLGGSFSWQRAWDTDWQSLTQVAYSAFGGDYQYDYELLSASHPMTRSLSQQNAIKDWTLRHQHTLQLTDELKVEAGVEGSRIEVQSQYVLEDQLDTLVSTSVLPGQRYMLAGFAQGTYQLTDWLQAKAGLRSTYYTGTQQNYFAPRVALTATLAKGLKAKATWGLYNQFLSKVVRLNDVGMGESFWMVAGEEEVPVLTASHSIIGMTYTKGPWNLDLEFYQKEINNVFTYQVAFDPIFQQLDPDTSQFFTGGAADTRGVDFLAKYKRKWYTSWVSYSLSKTTYQFAEMNDGAPFRPVQDQTHSIKLVQIFALGPAARWNISLSWLYHTGQPFTSFQDINRIPLGGEPSEDNYLLDVVLSPDVNGARLPDYHRLDMAASYLIFHREAAAYENPAKARVGFSIYNLYNRQNVRSRIPNPTVQMDAEKAVETIDRPFLPITPNVYVTLEF